jgi:hypothetical protein
MGGGGATGCRLDARSLVQLSTRPLKNQQLIFNRCLSYRCLWDKLTVLHRIHNNPLIPTKLSPTDRLADFNQKNNLYCIFVERRDEIILVAPNLGFCINTLSIDSITGTSTDFKDEQYRYRYVDIEIKQSIKLPKVY